MEKENEEFMVSGLRSIYIRIIMIRSSKSFKGEGVQILI